MKEDCSTSLNNPGQRLLRYIMESSEKCDLKAKFSPNVVLKDKVLKQPQNQIQSRFINFKKGLRSLSRAIKPGLLRLSLAMTSRSSFSQSREGPTRNDKIGVFQNSRYRTDGFALLRPKRKRAGFTLIELIIATSILSIIALLIYPAYRASSRSYQLSVVQSNLQQNARIGMKKMVKELEAGVVVIPEESDDAKDGGSINYVYEKDKPFKMAFYAWDSTPEQLFDNDIIALYAALSTANTEPVGPAFSSEGQEPLLYVRKYDPSLSNPEWSEPEPFILSDVKVTQLNFIIGGDNRDQILITLELAQQGPVREWRVFSIVSAARLGAR